MTSCGKLLFDPIKAFVDYYVLVDWAREIVAAALRYCFDYARKKRYEDFDSNKYLCSSEAYHFSLCTYETFQEEYEKRFSNK